MKKEILFGVGAALVIVLGSFLFYQAAIAPAPGGEGEGMEQIVGGDRDEHGCIGSAGYSWCEVKGKCLREWEEPCDTTSPTVFDMTVLVEGKEVMLQDGFAEEAVVPDSASVETYRIFGEPVYGDLSGDDVMDAAYYLTKETGGSGTFFYVVFAIGSESGYVGKEAVFLGDRIAPQNINITEGDAVANFAERAPDESFAVPPSIGKSVYLHYDAATDTVGEVVQNFEGEADVSRMTLTMKEWEWIKTEYTGDACTCPTGYTQSGEVCDPACRNSTPPCMAPSIACESLAGKGTVTPNKPGAFTLTFASEGNVAIGTDCNSMSGTYEKIGSGGEKQKITFGPIASTMMYCEGSQEQEFSGLLAKTSAYAFTGKGELLLYQGEESVSMFK